MDAALGVPAGEQPKPLLWRAAGHPLMPRTEALRKAEEEVRMICAALRPTSSGGGNARDMSTAAAAITAAAAAARREGRLEAAAALGAAASAAAAAVGTSGGGGLRAAALEAGGVVENKHSTDVESLTPHPHVSMSIHPQGKSCSDIGSISFFQ